MLNELQTPYEKGNKNQTTTWAECIAFYQELARRFPNVLHFEAIGTSDAGIPIHAGVITADGVHDRAQLKREGRPVFFNNNGIHPGEPEGVDACMALVRDFCLDPGLRARLEKTVFLFIPLYNVDGAHNRADTSRVNQDGPEQFGFRGNSLHLDLNRDFAKCDSLAAQAFNKLFTAWDPDVMVDTHTSNGADYSYTMTLIHTQPDKLGGGLGRFLRATMLPQIYQDMAQRGWPTCPYVNPVKDSPDHGIAEFLETPRFSTGYAALHHTIDRYESMRALVEATLDFTVEHAEQIQSLRHTAREEARHKRSWEVHWAMDASKPSSFRFKGYAARYKPSIIGHYQRLYYDRREEWEGDIAYYNSFPADIVVETPRAYLIPQAWRAAIERLEWNGVQVQRLDADQQMEVQCYHVGAVKSRPNAYEGHMYHDEVQLEKRRVTIQAKKGDVLVALEQDKARYAIEMLEPQGHDSFFRWGMFNGVLEKKEAFSDYVFEDHASELLASEPELRTKFDAWKAAHPELLTRQGAVLDFIFANCARYHEPEWRRYPVFALD